MTFLSRNIHGTTAYRSVRPSPHTCPHRAEVEAQAKLWVLNAGFTPAEARHTAAQDLGCRAATRLEASQSDVLSLT